MGENEVQELRRALSKVFDRLTRIETLLCERCETRVDQIEKMEKDVEWLKTNQSKAIGAAILFSILLPLALKLIVG